MLHLHWNSNKPNRWKWPVNMFVGKPKESLWMSTRIYSQFSTHNGKAEPFRNSPSSISSDRSPRWKKKVAKGLHTLFSFIAEPFPISRFSPSTVSSDRSPLSKKEWWRAFTHCSASLSFTINEIFTWLIPKLLRECYATEEK